MIDGKPPQKWEEEADVVSGFAGLAAAIEAKQAGSSVIILEKMKGCGSAKTIKARKAVILAAGGFANDIDLRTGQDPRLTADVGSTNKHSTTGEALLEAMRIGAMPVHLSWIQLGPWTCPDEKGFGIGPDFASYVAFPYGIVVDPATGNRFDCLVFGRIAGQNAARQ